MVSSLKAANLGNLWLLRQAKNRTMKRHYKISLKELIYLYETAEGKCRICDRKTDLAAHPHQKGKYNDVVCVDHDHKTGKFRGLLCGSCNSALGFAKDDTNILEMGVKYLKETGADQEVDND